MMRICVPCRVPVLPARVCPYVAVAALCFVVVFVACFVYRAPGAAAFSMSLCLSISELVLSVFEDDDKDSGSFLH